MQPGAQVADRFVIDRLARTGGMGAVYRAIDKTTGAAVALKVLHIDGARNVERFAREARILAEVAHPALVRYVAHGVTADGARYLAMEWLDGEDLGQRLAHGRLPTADAVAMIRRAAEALGVLHARGVVHRDLKPSNLFLVDGRADRVKVLDLGIARFAEGGLSTTRTGTTVGTPGYIAPEQARGSRELDARADVFALGCVLFESITGRAAFEGNHAMAVLAKILLEEATRIDEVLPGVPAPLVDLCARLLAKDPAARPGDGAAVAAALDAVGSLADAPSAPPAARALTGGEQRVLCIVLAQRGTGDTLPTRNLATQPTPADDLGSLRDALAPLGLGLEPLAGGAALVGLLTGPAPAATDQAARAARAALTLQARRADLRVALAAGRGVVDQRLPVGEVIERGLRVLEHALPGRVRLDPVAAGLLDTRFDLRTDERGLYCVGERDVLQATRTLLGRPTRCVGRDRELATLDALWSECRAEPIARAVLLTGSAGVGKSRVRYEFLRRAGGELADDTPGDATGTGIVVLIGRGDPLRAGSPFALLAQAIRRAAGIQQGEPPELQRGKLRARAGRHLPAADAARIAELLGELAGVESDHPSDALRAARQNPIAMGDAMRAAWEDWLDAECRAQPVLLVLEDLHWGDLPTIRFVDAALRHLRERPFMVLAVARSDVHDSFPNLWAERAVQGIQLDALSPRAAERLVREVLGEAAADDVVQQVVQRAGGNAFYLEELIRAVADGGDRDAITLPETVLAMMQARLDALGGDGKRVLRAASVFGETFWRGGVRALLGGEPIDEALEELVAREAISRRPAAAFPGEVELAFRHGLLREAVYATLTDEDRALGHRLAGEWLEQAGYSDAVALAEHFDRGRAPEQAVAWYRRAALQALEGDDFATAIARARQGLARGGERQTRGALALLQAQAHSWRAEHGDAEVMAGLAADLLPAGSAAWFEAIAVALASAARLGGHDRAEAHVRAAAGIEATTAAAQGAQLECLAHAALALMNAGRLALADEAMARAEALATSIPARTLGPDETGDGGAATLEPRTEGALEQMRAQRAYHAGDSAGSLLGQARSVAALERAGERRAACRNRINLGYAYMEMGEYADAVAELERARADAERMSLWSSHPWALHNLGSALAAIGQLERAFAVEQAAVAHGQLHGDARLEGASRVYLSRIHLLAGNPEAAEAEGRLAVERLGPFPGTRAGAHAYLARALLRLGRTAEAVREGAAAAALLRSLGAIQEFEPVVRLVEAETLDAAGRGDEARAALAAARDRLRARAAAISEPRWRASFLAVDDAARTLALAEAWGM